MGSWSHGPFDNDAAADFLDEAGSSPSRAVPKALAAIQKHPAGAYLDIDDTGAAWAACELVALAFGRGSAATLSDNVLAIVAKLKPKEQHRVLALGVLSKIGDPATSELAALWHEGSDGAQFDHTMADLKTRLDAASAGPLVLAKPKTGKAGDVFVLPVTADSSEVVVVQIVGPGEVAVFEGTCGDDARALACVKTRPARRVCTFLKKLPKWGREIGNTPVRKDLKGKRLYGYESGGLGYYVIATANHGGIRCVESYEEVRDLQPLRQLGLDSLRGVALGNYLPEPIKTPEEREIAMYRTHGKEWAARREITTPGPFGDVEAVEQLVGWMEECGVDNALGSFDGLASGSHGYGRPNEESERSPYAFAALVALWRGTWPREDWPAQLATRIPTAPNPGALAGAVKSARKLMDEVITFDAELRLIWDAAADGGKALRDQVASLKAALSD